MRLKSIWWTKSMLLWRHEESIQVIHSVIAVAGYLRPGSRSSSRCEWILLLITRVTLQIERPNFMCHPQQGMWRCAHRRLRYRARRITLNNTRWIDLQVMMEIHRSDHHRRENQQNGKLNLASSTAEKSKTLGEWRSDIGRMSWNHAVNSV